MQKPTTILQKFVDKCAADGIKLQRPKPVVFTTTNTGVSEILEDLVNSLPEGNNLKLSAPKLK